MNVRTTAAAGLLAMSGAALSSASAAPADFSFRMSGEPAVLPLQVFHNGTDTYFQFRSDQRVIPAILVEHESSVGVAKYHRAGPFIVVPGVAPRYRVQFGSLSGVVSYTGARVVKASMPATVDSQPAGAQDRAVALPAVASSSAVVGSNAEAVAKAPERSLVASDARTVSKQSTATASTNTEASSAQGQTPSPAAAHEYDVPFESGSTVLGRDAMQALKAALDDGKAVKELTIIGRDDRDYKEGVARQRALAIRKLALDAGVTPQSIVMREAFAQDGASSGTSFSTVRVVRKAAGNPPNAGDDAPITSVGAALATIQRGLSALVALRAIDEGRARDFVVALRTFTDKQKTPDAEDAADRLQNQVWTMGPSDGTAQRGLRRWAERAGMTLDWQADLDYPVRQKIEVRGTARTAVHALRDKLASASIPLSVDLDQNRIIVRRAKG